MTGKDFTCIAVDMGASGIRVMLGVVSGGGIVYEEIHRINNELIRAGGHDCWDMDRISSEIRIGISKAIAASSDIPSTIGVDSWGVDFLLMDEKGDLVDNPVAYRDDRTVGMRKKWESMMPEAETFRRTGINFYIFNSLFQLLSLKDTEALKKTSRILFIPCYVNYLLSGRAQNELTISSTSQLLQVEGDQWDACILDKLYIQPEVLGKVIKAGTRLGPVTIPEASGMGMECIAVCGHDTACVVAALPVENPSFAYISAGTWCIVGVELDRPLVGEEALILGFTNERGYNNTYRTLKNIVGLWLVQGLRNHLPEKISYTELEEMARDGGTDTQVIDPDDPLFYNPEDMKEAFDAYLTRTGQPLPGDFGGYLTCAYDSLCFSFRYYIEKLEKLSGKPIEVLHLVGGGSQSEILNQSIATICKRMVVSGPVEGAILGNILVQALAAGRIKNLEEGRALVRRSYPVRTYYPVKQPDSISRRYEKYLELKNTQ